MRSTNMRHFLTLALLAAFLAPLGAEDVRAIPLDMYLIVDGSSALQNSKNDTIAWINQQVVDRILADGDRLTIWAAGDRAQVIYSDTVSAAGKAGIKEKLRALDTGGKTADFSGALGEASSRLPGTASDRLAVTMLITGSAENLEPALAKNAQGLLRWFRSEKYERWQVLIVAPDLGKKVQQAGAAYMSALR